MAAKRPQTAAEERDTLVRKDTPVRGSAIPVEVPDEDTDMFPLEERQQRRENKPTPHRIRKLEAFKDDVLERLPKLETNVQTLVDWHREEREDRRASQAQQAALEKVRINSRAKIIIAIIGAIGTLLGVLGTLVARGDL